ncbi:MAG: hypothetical protein KatS3mg109_1342 [Pirellulaceae bacterium]|nr:MAG: hypothetical protein KatS3mg109_1204 [Pirellulaceae bacterium]GIW90910.1 MAG: hypothetical protein KatS3mg109_1342 [Pirellulaceae bacterium]
MLQDQRPASQLPLNILASYALQTLNVAFNVAHERLCSELARRGVEIPIPARRNPCTTLCSTKRRPSS